MKRTLLVTGGIGSGKSLVCALLERRGLPVYDSDTRTKALYDDPSLFARVESAVGAPLRTEDGRPDLKALAARIFSDDAARGRLEAVVYPAVREDFLSWRAARPQPWAVIESAVLAEKPLLSDLYDFVLRVEAPETLRLERVCRRDTLSEESVRSRMAAQAPGSTPAGYVIRNDSTTEALEAAVDTFFSYLCRTLV